MTAHTLLAKDLAQLFDLYWSDGEGLDAFLNKLLEACVEWFSASGVSLFLFNDSSGGYELAAQSGPASQVPDGTVLRPGEGIAGMAIVKGFAQLVQDKGSRKLSTAMVVPLCTLSGNCIGVLNVSRQGESRKFDVSDLDKADQIARYLALALNNANLFDRLNQEATRLDAIISCLGVGVLVIGPTGEIQAWNVEATRVLQADPLSRPEFESTLSSQLSTALVDSIRMALTGVGNSARACDSVTETTWSISSSPLPQGGCAVAIHDISKYEQALNELARVNRLAEIGQMTAAIAHEIRNPLTGIRSAAQMVQSMGGEAVEFGQMIEQEALKLNSLCDQFLEFARPLIVAPRDIDPAASVRQIVDLHRAEFASKGVELCEDFDDHLPTIQADPLRFEQVCRNLVINALQACSAGDTVTLTLTESGLKVSDSGIGIEPSMMERLFTPFFTTKPAGTGLGLSNIRKIVDAHGWTIMVNSEPGSGTEFSVVWENAA
ncbi:MAG: ATP-binding protein [Fimbriimonadaceae bacterium]